MPGGNREIEVKLRLEDAAQGRTLLGNAGFRLTRPRAFEQNVVFDTAAADLRRNDVLLRLRSAAGETLLTFKGPAEPGKHKNREEIESGLSDGEAFEQILARLGFTPVYRYEKYRTEYAPPEGPGHALLDETPIGVFIELEGSPEWIDQAAGDLGFAQTDYITATYAELQIRAHNGIRCDMVFSREPF